jgi:predicted DNA-binding protein
MKGKPLKDALFSVRMPYSLRERLEMVECRTRITPSILTLEALEAICIYVETHGEIRMPFHLVPSAKLEALKSAASQIEHP